MLLEIIKHPIPSSQNNGGNGNTNHDSLGPNKANNSEFSGRNGKTSGLLDRRKGQLQQLHIPLNSKFSSSPANWPLASPFSGGSSECRQRALEGQKAAEEVNRWIAGGDITLLEALVLAGRADMLMGAEYRENFLFAHPRSRQFLSELPEYKENYEHFLEAIIHGDQSTVSRLMDYRRLIQARHPQTHASMIHMAAIFQQPAILRLLLDSDRTLLDARDFESRTPLHYAAAFAGILKESKSAAAEEEEEEEEGPMMTPTNGSHFECFDILLDYGANETLLDIEGYTPMNFHRSPQLLDINQIRGLNKFPIHPGDHVDKLIAERDVKALREIVLAGDYSVQIEGRIFPPESRDLGPILANLQMRIQAVHEAVRDDDQMTLKQLVDQWDFAIGRDHYGRTPLHLAVLLGRPRIARYLLLLYPKCVNLMDKPDSIALRQLFAGEQQRVQMTRILCRAGADSAKRETVRNDGTMQNPPMEIARMEDGDEKDEEEGEEEEHEGEKLVKKRPRRGGEGGGGGRISRGENGAMDYDNNGDGDPYNAYAFSSDGDDGVDSEVERRILAIDFGQKRYSQLEQLHHQGRTDEVWRVVRKHLGNENLVKYIYAYGQAQSRLGQVFAAIEANDMRRLKSLLDEEIVQTRDNRGLAPLHVAVLKERHEMVEYIGQQHPEHINIADHLGRTAAHYAAPQQNAIYDTLADAGANVKIVDKNGFCAETYRSNPENMVQPLPLPSLNGPTRTAEWNGNGRKGGGKNGNAAETNWNGRGGGRNDAAGTHKSII